MQIVHFSQLPEVLRVAFYLASEHRFVFFLLFFLVFFFYFLNIPTDISFSTSLIIYEDLKQRKSRQHLTQKVWKLLITRVIKFDELLL